MDENHSRSAALPAEVRAFAIRAASEAPVKGQVRITQKGEMWLKPGGRTTRFTANQELTIERIAFSWRARFPLMGPLALNVVDAYDGERGELAVRLLALPLQRQRGPETTAGVSAVIGGERLTVAIEFDEAGDVVRASSQMRKRKVDGDWQATPWGGEFRDYAEFDGFRLPGVGEAYWDLPEGRYVYWRGETDHRRRGAAQVAARVRR